jgi:hypothetical protein
MNTYQRTDLGVSKAYVAEGSRDGEHWVEIYLTLPGSQTTLLVTLPLPDLPAKRALVTVLH